MKQYVFLVIAVLKGIGISLADNNAKLVGFNESLCSHLGKCGSEDGPGILRCHCDSLCRFYGDCCYGFSLNRSNDETIQYHESVSTDLRCEDVRGGPHKFWIVYPSRPSNMALLKLHEMCMSAKDPVFRSLPVYEPISRLNLRNIYCAHMNTGILKSTFIFWKVEVTGCMEKIEHYAKHVDGGILGLYNVYNRIFNEPSCSVRFVPPVDATPRICFPSDRGCVGKALHDTCFGFQNPVVLLSSDTDRSTISTRYRNHICQICGGILDGKVQCRLEQEQLPDSSLGKSVILNDINPLALSDTFLFPKGCDRGSTHPKTKGACAVLQCPDGMVQNYLDCVNPIMFLKGIEFDLDFRLVNQSAYIGEIPYEAVNTILNGRLKNMFKDFVTNISISTQTGEFGEDVRPCILYDVTLHILVKDEINFNRSKDIKAEVNEAVRNLSAAFKKATNLKTAWLGSYSDDNSDDEPKCEPSDSRIVCPRTWRALIISFALSSACFITSLAFEFRGAPVGSFAKFEFVSFKLVHLLNDLLNVGAILLACYNYAPILRNTEVVLHLLCLSKYTWLSIIGHQIWRTMLFKSVPIRCSNDSFSKRTSCFIAFVSPGVVVGLSYLSFWLQLDRLSLSYNNGGSLYRSNFDFIGISVFLFVPRYFAVAVSAIFCISVLLASRHLQSTVTKANHWVVQNIRLLILLLTIVVDDFVYASKPYFHSAYVWSFIRAATFSSAGVSTLLLEVVLYFMFRQS